MIDPWHSVVGASDTLGPAEIEGAPLEEGASVRLGVKLGLAEIEGVTLASAEIEGVRLGSAETEIEGAPLEEGDTLDEGERLGVTLGPTETEGLRL